VDGNTNLKIFVSFVSFCLRKSALVSFVFLFGLPFTPDLLLCFLQLARHSFSYAWPFRGYFFIFAFFRGLPRRRPCGGWAIRFL
jgi:hypothetical protein